MTLLFRTIAASAAVICTFATSADIIKEYTCAECRSTEFSRDFGNYALNLTYGPNSTQFEDEMIIKNLEGGWVYVDLSFVLVENIISNFGDFIGLDLGVPDGTMLIETTTDTTESDEYRIALNLIDTMGPLPVGENNDPIPPGGDDDDDNGGGGDSSGGGSTGSGGVGAGSGSGSGGAGSGSGGGGTACTSAGNGDWYCVSY